MALKLRAFLITLLIVVLVALTTALYLWIDHGKTRGRQEVLVQDLAKIVEQQITDTDTQVGGLVTELADLIQVDGGVQRMGEAPRRKMASAYCRSIIGCNAIVFVGADGRTVASSNVPGPFVVDVSDRLYFQAIQTTKRRYIGAALVSRLPGSRIQVPIAEPVFDRAGRFLGAIVVTMDTAHFTNFYSLMGFSVSPTVTVFKRNGDIVARHPDMKQHIGKNASQEKLFTTHLKTEQAGVYHSVSPLDGKTRLAAYRAIPELDLVVFTGIELDAAFGAWKERAVLLAAISATFLFLLIPIIHLGYRSMTRHIALKAKNAELDRLSNLDGLTGLANRRRFDQALEREWAHHKRHDTPLSLLLIDVDYFKSYNDRYGHQQGDDVLRRVAMALQSCVQRDTDLLARYGGEEFVAILTCDTEGAMLIAQRMRLAVESMLVTHDYSDVGPLLTVSIGLANATTTGAESPEILLKATDDALYKAKREGRNQVAVHQTGSGKLVAVK